MDYTTKLFFRCFYQSSPLKFKLFWMIGEPILKILIHTKCHYNALQLDALFFLYFLWLSPKQSPSII